MPFQNGANITADYQFELSNTTSSLLVFGAGAAGVWSDSKAPDGLFGVPDTKTQDVVLNGQHGSFGNPDYLGPRVIHLPVILKNNTEANLIDKLLGLQAAWVPTIIDVQLAFQWPTAGMRWYFGRPRGMTVDLALERRGAIHCLLRFDCNDPAMYGD